MRTDHCQSLFRSSPHARRVIVVCALLILLGACSTPGYRYATRRPTRTHPPISTSLNTLASEETPQSAADDLVVPEAPAAWEQAALNLQQVLDNETDPSLDPIETQQSQQDRLDESLQSDAQTPDQSTPDAPATVLATITPPARIAESDSSESTTAAAPPEPTIAQQVLQLAESLRAAAPANDDPITSLVRASILASLWPLTPETPDAPDSVILAPGERTRVDVASQLVSVLASPQATTASLVQALDDARTDLTSDGSGFTIAHAQLARRVEGFGKYDPFPAHTFLAGKPNRLIVYTEPANFGHRRPTASDHTISNSTTEATWVVDLSQELTLYHEASSDLQAWHRPKARIIDASRNRQRDYYLINEIVLPANLSVGSYRLKISTRDETTGALAEATIKIDLVADPALAFGNR